MQLTFTGPLDVATANDASHYVVQVNDQPVAATALYNVGSSTVALTLPSGSLRSGDRVVVFWQDLLDAAGKAVSGQTGSLMVR